MGPRTIDFNLNFEKVPKDELQPFCVTLDEHRGTSTGHPSVVTLTKVRPPSRLLSTGTQGRRRERDRETTVETDGRSGESVRRTLSQCAGDKVP